MADMNFLPEDYLDRRLKRRTNAICMTLFIVVMGAVVGAFFVTDQQRTEIRRVRRQVDEQFEEAAKRLEQLDQLQQRKQEMMAKAKVTSSLLERVPRTIILSELVNRMPMTLGLLELDLETKALKGPGANARTALDKAKAARSLKDGDDAQMPQVAATEVTMNLVGVAPTDVQVAQFMAALGQSQMFDDLNLVYSQQEQIEGKEVRKFRVEMTVNQDLNIHEFEPTMVKRELNQNPLGDRLEIKADALPKTPPPPPAGNTDGVRSVSDKPSLLQQKKD